MVVLQAVLAVVVCLVLGLVLGFADPEELVVLGVKFFPIIVAPKAPNQKSFQHDLALA